ncbi:MAG TPA: ParB/RepB/Spo0J family partition protein [Acidimicrobiales bacterium]|nr:ParB/RepB/Spo0J family partition protein [Acidimicrobiales bacterium]
MSRRSGLGRGLGALIPSDSVRSNDSVLRDVPLSLIKPNQYQPRKEFDEEALSSLVDSIKAVGVLQPVLLRESGESEYELIAGERRCRAARRAGLQSIPALVQSIDDVASLERALVENLHREDLNPLDEAAAYQQLIEDFNMTHEKVAQRVGKSRTAISNALRLFQLPTSILRYVREGFLSAGHARALLMTPDRSLQERLAKIAVSENLSVRALEDLVREAAFDDELVEDNPEEPAALEPISTSVGPVVKAPLRAAGVLELEQLLADHLNTRVKVTLGGRHGKVTIDFATIEDLERIYRTMLGTEGA